MVEHDSNQSSSGQRSGSLDVHKPSVIVCATRGGEASHRAQDRAIELAKQHNARLIFLYIVDLEFVSDTAAPIVVDVEREVRGMGHFLLLMAKERAQAQGVEADIAIREGKVREAIQDFIREAKADMLVLGRPRSGAVKQVFNEQELTPFALAVQQALGIPVLVV